MHGTMDVPVEGGSHMATQHDKQFKHADCPKTRGKNGIELQDMV